MMDFPPVPPLRGVGVSEVQVEEQKKKAIEEDPSVYAYDEVYDDMKEKEARPKMQAKVVREVIRPVLPPSIVYLRRSVSLLRCLKEYSLIFLAKNTSC